MDAAVIATLEQCHGIQIVQKIGEGGFSEVFAARSAQGVSCAIKVSREPIAGIHSPAAQELCNLHLVKGLSGHPRIVSLMDIWVVCNYLVTRWELAPDPARTLEDVSLSYRRAGYPGIPLRKLLVYLHEAAEGIDFLNAQGFYHRDIKPSNLLMFFDHVKIGDLGLSALKCPQDAPCLRAGTLGFLPPEAQRGQVTPTVDLYGLAATYVRLRSGQNPFGNTPPEIRWRQQSGQPILHGLGEKEAALVLRTLSPNPSLRPQMPIVAWVEVLQSLCRVPVRKLRSKQKVNAVSPARCSCSLSPNRLRQNLARHSAHESLGKKLPICTRCLRPRKHGGENLPQARLRGSEVPPESPQQPPEQDLLEAETVYLPEFRPSPPRESISARHLLILP
jgi:serine/threonine protein kinase